MSLCYTLLDVAGGYSPSMLDAMRRALDLSKILGTLEQDYHSLTFEEVFRLATLGGSQGQAHRHKPPWFLHTLCCVPFKIKAHFNFLIIPTKSRELQSELMCFSLLVR